MILKTAAILLCANALFLAGCNSDSSGPGTDPKAKQLLVSLSTGERQVVKSDNGFGFRLFSALSKEETAGNIIISPLSISVALTMAYNGARNATESAMAEQLGFGGMDRAAVNAFYAKLLPALTTVDHGVQLSIANSIWSDQGLEVKPEFLELNKATFDAETQSLDFAAPQTAPTINNWVKAKTKGLIPSIVPAQLDPSWVMILINALYFKGAWALEFDPKDTYDGAFHLADGSTRACRMMRRDTNFLSFEDAKVRALELPYNDSLYSMVFLQPKEENGMPGLIADLAAGAWEGWESKFAIHEGAVHVPKFKLEYSKSLSGMLQDMGMGAAFSDQADFTGIRAEGGLFISDVIHKTFVNVDEKGTEAAAVTAVMVGISSGPMDLIRLDRPFVFVIRERNSGAILFLGRIMNPAAS
jgi:serine protease inhibitor